MAKLRKVAEFSGDTRTAKVYYDADFGEFTVRFYIFDVHQMHADYHTDDRKDAISSAQHELVRW